MFNIKILQNANFKYKKEAYYKLGINKNGSMCSNKTGKLEVFRFFSSWYNDYILELYI